MSGRNASEAPVRERNGLASRILLQEGDEPGKKLMLTMVEVAPDSRRRSHNRDAEQVYVVLEGSGNTGVGDEEREVLTRNLVYIPLGVAHGAPRTWRQGRSYISPSQPSALDTLAAYDTGQLRPESGKEQA